MEEKMEEKLETDKRHYDRFLTMRMRRIWYRALRYGNRSVTSDMWQAVAEYVMASK